MSRYRKEDLLRLHKQHDCLVGVDSDGCVFDTMEVKQKQHFHPLIIRAWGLELVEPQLRRAAEFVNLYSQWRGQNRFVNLLRLFDLLPTMPGVVESGVKLPGTSALRQYVESGVPLGNPSLAAAVRQHASEELRRVLEWSYAVNEDISQNMADAPPFDGVRDALNRIAACTDMIVVSQTPEEALLHEWRKHGLLDLPLVIAGQELGTKAEHLALAMSDRYPPTRVLMLGDAPGDQEAAHQAGALFFPVNPGHEAESWQRLTDDAFDRFLAGTYAGAYEKALVDAFNALLPARPPWLDGS